MDFQHNTGESPGAREAESRSTNRDKPLGVPRCRSAGSRRSPGKGSPKACCPAWLCLGVLTAPSDPQHPAPAPSGDPSLGKASAHTFVPVCPLLAPGDGKRSPTAFPGALAFPGTRWHLDRAHTVSWGFSAASCLSSACQALNEVPSLSRGIGCPLGVTARDGDAFPARAEAAEGPGAARVWGRWGRRREVLGSPWAGVSPAVGWGVPRHGLRCPPPRAGRLSGAAPWHMGCKVVAELVTEGQVVPGLAWEPHRGDPSRAYPGFGKAWRARCPQDHAP